MFEKVLLAINYLYEIFKYFYDEEAVIYRLTVGYKPFQLLCRFSTIHIQSHTHVFFLISFQCIRHSSETLFKNPHNFNPTFPIRMPLQSDFKYSTKQH